MTLQVQKSFNIELDNIITTRTYILDVRRAERFSLQAVIDVNVPSAAVTGFAAVDVTANTFTATAHGFTTGLKGQLTTTGGLPAGTAVLTDYFIIVVDADTYKVASSLANALAGTAIDLTTQGTGNHTFTPTALAGGAVKLQKSNKLDVLDASYTYASADWTDVAAATSVTADATNWFEVGEPGYAALAIHYTLTAGRMSTDNFFVQKGF